MKYSKVIITLCIAGAMCACQGTGKKSYDMSKPIEAIEAIGNDVAEQNEEWDREQWDVMADNLENALKSLPVQMKEDEINLVAATVTRMKVYAERHKRTAAGLLEVINGYQQKNTAPAAVPAVTPAATPQAIPAGLQTATIKQEGGYTNVRKSPSTSAAIVTKVKDGSPILCKVYNGSWYIVYNNAGQQLGYVHASKIIPTTAKVTTEAPRGAIEYEWLTRRYVTEADLMGMSSAELRILRNAIYALHGRMFKDASLRAFFNAEPWYNGYRSEIPASELNKFEKYNVQFIQRYE